VTLVEPIPAFPSLVAIQMVLVDCSSLFFRLQDSAPIGFHPAKLCLDLLCALQRLQWHSFVHNGITLSNILFAEEEGMRPLLAIGSQLSLADEGVSLHPLTNLGDPTIAPYIAPELQHAPPVFGTFDSDIFALGVCFIQIADRLNWPGLRELGEGMTRGIEDGRFSIERCLFHELFRGVEPTPDPACAAKESQLDHYAWSLMDWEGQSC
jgi:serine/threonine protein kinase